jgi:hypothetical protein
MAAPFFRLARIMQRFAYGEVTASREVTARKYPIIILHITGVAREPKRFGEMIHDLGVVTESVREFFRVRPVAVSKTGATK